MYPRMITIILGALIGSICLPSTASANEYEHISARDLKRLDLSRYWYLKLPLENGECVTRIALVDDALYALTTQNRALCLHAPTGVIRWSNYIADSGQTVRGPTHNSDYVFFTTPGSVRIFDRQTGELAGQPRVLRGVVIEVASETATISIGEEHGVQIGDILNVYPSTEYGLREDTAKARLKITSVQRRSSRGRLERIDVSAKSRPGDRVEADVMLPMQEVKLPFAASSAAVSDGQRVFVGAANERFYAVDLRTGVSHWQLRTPHTVSATPVLMADLLYIAGQDGLVVCCTKEEKAKNWTFQTEGPIFAELVVLPTRVYVTSTDRSIYCLDRHSGRRIWRERFDAPLNHTPIVAGDYVYLTVPNEGLVVMEAESGKRVWKRPQGGEFLLSHGDDTYLLTSEGDTKLLRVGKRNGRVKEQAAVAGTACMASGFTELAMYFCDVDGSTVCIRPASALRLQASQVEHALRNDKKLKLAAEKEAQTAQLKPPPATQPARRSLFEDDDGLASRSTAKPVGGHGVVTPPGQEEAAEPPKEGETPAEDAEEGAAESAAKDQEDEEDDAPETEEAKPDEEKASDEDEDAEDDADEDDEEDEEDQAKEEKKADKKDDSKEDDEEEEEDDD